MTKPLDMSGEAIWARVNAASAVSDLSPETRLDAKLDMSAEGIARRIQTVSDLRDLCMQLQASVPAK